MQRIFETLKMYLIITVGTLMVASGVYFFKFPNNFSTGGVSGISVILGYLSPKLSAGSYVLIINIILLIVGFIFIGTSFGVKTVYSSLLMSFSIWGLEKICPMTSPMTDQPFLELSFAVLLPAVGSAVLFNTGASTGGTDIAAMILKKYAKIDIGKALFLVDAVIAVTAGLVFGIETGLFSCLGLIAKAFFVDSVIESINTSKYFTIVTENPEPVLDFIMTELHRGATESTEFEGAYSKKKKTLILTVVNRMQAVRLKNFVHANDKGAFMVISTSSDVIGKGFRTPMM